jgi:hypothetical protein
MAKDAPVIAFLLTQPHTQLVVGGSLPDKAKAAGTAEASPCHAMLAAASNPSHGRSSATMLSLWEEDPMTWLSLSKTAWSAYRREKASRNRQRATSCAITLADLLAAGLVLARPSCLFVTFGGLVSVAALSAEGQIFDSSGTRYASPSGWSLAVKRASQPSLKSDMGWRSVRYGVADGPSLEELRHELEELRRRTQ